MGGRGAGPPLQWEHRPAGAVEVAGQDVDDVDEPAAQRAEFDCGRTDPAVDGRRGGGGDLACQGADLVGGHAAVGGDVVRREPVGQRTNVVDTADVFGHSPEVDKAFFEEHVHDREQQRGVGARPGSNVPIGQFGRACAGRVDDDEPAAALTQRPQLAGKSAAVAKLPLDTRGFAPMITK